MDQLTEINGISFQMTKKGTQRKLASLEAISGADAIKILRLLVERYPPVAAKIDEVAKAILGDVSVDDIADSVFVDLESLRVEDVWDRSGPHRDGYVDAGEIAWQMVEAALDTYRDDIKKYTSHSMKQPAKNICMGVLKGLYDFHFDSECEFKSWAIDAPADYFWRYLDEWQILNGRRPPTMKMKKFLEQHCAEWADKAWETLIRQK